MNSGIRRGLLAAMSVGFVVNMAHAQLRIVNYNVAQLNGVPAAMTEVFGHLMADDKPGFAVAPHVFVFQEVQSTDVAPLLTRLNTAGSTFGVTYTQGTYTNNGENGVAGAQAMFYRADTLVEIPSGHKDLNTGASRQSDRWLLQLVGYDSPDAQFYIYSSHLKASTGSSNQQLRLAGAQVIRADADALPEGTHIIYAGDWNVYNNTEPAYLHFLSAGPGQGIDALGSGPWGGVSNAIKHTQSPQLNGPLVGGGMDDRFDHQMGTGEWHDGEGLSLIPNTYRAFGNDGNHYDIAINTGNNTYYPADIPRSNIVANSLYSASDHVPVVADYQIPAALAASMTSDVGRVIQGASVSVEVFVSNDAFVVEPTGIGADILSYAVAGTGALLGGDGGAVLATIPASTDSVLLTLDTNVVGSLVGAAEVSTSSQGAANPFVSLPLGGQVVRRSNASFSDAADIDTLALSPSFSPDTGVQSILFDVYNFGFDADQALLDIDTLDGAAAPLSLAGGLQQGVADEAAPHMLSFNTNGLTPGVYNYFLTLNVSDEDLPGETVDALTIDLAITIGGGGSIPGDVNGDCTVDIVDLSLALATYGLCDGAPGYNPAADFDADNCVNLTDLSILLANYSQSCP